MTPEEITNILEQQFPQAVEMPTSTSWQVDTDKFRLLVLLSDDHSWLRVLVPILPFQEAEPFLQQLLEANFDTTQETRYALHENVLWGVFQHSRQSLSPADFSAAVQRLVLLRERGVTDSFNELRESGIRQIVLAAKLQGQSLQATLQTLDRFYEEGLMGDMEQSAESRDAVLAAWRYQLERLWPEVET
ncbi:hypothetical protein [Microcoleus sp. FACHB-672]|uniref:hypothetical protein n=1 Tax=Microcoleus sp. FACHB-672 TaxID=2692825 RepID=UPI001687E5D6|nr:hypothetical protein [Microcoleus sp. FACHB-672]MBD2039615.1 hypothetical protein [Microcoleus sp. FACHB-672]